MFGSSKPTFQTPLSRSDSSGSSESGDSSVNTVKVYDHATDTDFKLKAKSRRDKMLLVKDLKAADAKLPADQFVLTRLKDLRTEEGDVVDVMQAFKFASKYLCVTADHIFQTSVKTPGPFVKSNSFKKRLLHIRFLFDLGKVIITMATTNPKSGSVRIYPLASALSDKGLESKDEVKLENTHGTLFFDVGKLEKIPYIMAVGSKVITVFQYTFEKGAFFEVAVRKPPSLYFLPFSPDRYLWSLACLQPIPLPKGTDGADCRAILFADRVYVALGNKVYWFLDTPVLMEVEADQGRTGSALALFSVGPDVLLCFEDVAFFVGKNLQPPANMSVFRFHHKPASFCKSPRSFLGGNPWSYFSSFPTHSAIFAGKHLVAYHPTHLELFDLVKGTQLPPLKVHSARSLNEEDSFVRLNLTNGPNQIPCLCQLATAPPR